MGVGGATAWLAGLATWMGGIGCCADGRGVGRAAAWLAGELLGGLAVLRTGWLACSKAVANSCTVGKRCCGTLASALSTTCSTAGGSFGIFSCKGGGGTLRCWLMTCHGFPWKGCSPLSHS